MHKFYLKRKETLHILALHLSVISLVCLLIFIEFPCPFKFVFRIPCPACGTLHALRSIIKLDFEEDEVEVPTAADVEAAAETEVEDTETELDDDLAASDEDSRNIHFVYGNGTATKKEGDFKVKKGTNVIFETSEENLFLDENGTVPYDPSDLTSDITVYRIKK